MDGKPRIVSPQYLGPADEMIAKLAAYRPGCRYAASISGSETWPQRGPYWTDWTWSAWSTTWCPRDGGIPIVSHAYPGDHPDVTQFTTVLDELVSRYRLLVHSVESLTVIYDAGQNSATNHEQVEAAGIGFVGSLPPSDHLTLPAVPRSRYQRVDADRFDDLSTYDTTVTALGVTRRAVLTHSPTLHDGQSRGLDQTLAKARARLAELQTRLHRGNKHERKKALAAAEQHWSRRLPAPCPPPCRGG